MKIRNYSKMIKRIICFGLGYTAYYFCLLLKKETEKIPIYATYHNNKQQALWRQNNLSPNCHLIQPYDIPTILDEGTLLLISAPPHNHEDPFLRDYAYLMQRFAQSTRWIGYLSSTSVYSAGHNEEASHLVDETFPAHSPLPRAQHRHRVERQWLKCASDLHIPVHIFRLAGIYGPGRNVLERLLKGNASGVLKKGQTFSRIHVEDIASSLMASLRYCLNNSWDKKAKIYNVCDDLSAPASDVLSYGAGLLGIPPPPMVPYEKANMSPMAQGFYRASRRISNARIKKKLGVSLRYPTYREGLQSLATDFLTRP